MHYSIAPPLQNHELYVNGKDNSPSILYLDAHVLQDWWGDEIDLDR
jgi:hypothetical protein